MDRRKIVEKLEQAEQENLNTKPKRAVVAVYWILRLIVIGVMVMTIIHKNYESTFVCVLVLILFMLPRFVERNFRIELPSTLEIIILVFIFAAEILGELKSYFITYPHWDSMLHTTTGFISAAFGFALVDLLNRNKPQHFKLSPVFLALVAFCFSMTVGVLWEFFEFSMDYLFHMDMQKDTVIHAFASVTLDPTNSNIPIYIDNITDVAVNSQSLGLGGYLDVGLYDTMQDLFVNFIGAVVFSIIGLSTLSVRLRSASSATSAPSPARIRSPSSLCRWSCRIRLRTQRRKRRPKQRNNAQYEKLPARLKRA